MTAMTDTMTNRNQWKTGRLATVVFLAFGLSASTAQAQDASEFECDFDEVLGEFSDASCDYSLDVDGSFDVSCDFSKDDEATDSSMSGDFDASCDVEEDGSWECDYSSSYDYDSPTEEISTDVDCDTVGSGEIINFSCGDPGASPELRDLLKKLDVTCGVPQSFSSIFSQLVNEGDEEAAVPLVNEMSRGVKSVSGLEDKQKIRGLLKQAKERLAEGRDGAAKRKVRRAQKLAAAAAKELRRKERMKLCATDLFCFTD